MTRTDFTLLLLDNFFDSDVLGHWDGLTWKVSLRVRSCPTWVLHPL